MIFNINNTVNMLGSYIILSYIKVSYSNCFLGFLKSGNGSIFLKKLPYGFNYTNVYDSNDCLDIETDYEGISNTIFREDYCLSYFNIFNVDYSYKIYTLTLYLKKFKIAVSAGTYCFILNKDYSTSICLIKLPSNIEVNISLLSTMYIGRNSNIFSKNRYFGKYFYTLLYKKTLPKVRGIAKNPVDHPNGGRSKIKKPFKNPWGLIAKKGK